MFLKNMISRVSILQNKQNRPPLLHMRGEEMLFYCIYLENNITI